MDPSPNNTWSNWDANQRDLFFLDINGQYVTHFNITSWDYTAIYNAILTLLPECTYDLGDMNADAGWNVQDIVLLINCVLNDSCGELDNDCAGDLNGDTIWNVQDIVLLINCVLNDNCGELDNAFAKSQQFMPKK